MLVAAEAALLTTIMRITKEQAVRAAVAMGANQKQPLILALREQLIPEAVVVAAVKLPQVELLAAQAAPASSSLSTTSALPQSSPSSHRRSGLHQRVR
jgi:hypothetical protein